MVEDPQALDGSFIVASIGSAAGRTVLDWLRVRFRHIASAVGILENQTNLAKDVAPCEEVQDPAVDCWCSNPRGLVVGRVAAMVVKASTGLKSLGGVKGAVVGSVRVECGERV